MILPYAERHPLASMETQSYAKERWRTSFNATMICMGFHSDSSRVKTSKANCSKQYAGVYDCLKANIAKPDSEAESCKELLDEFARC